MRRRDFVTRAAAIAALPAMGSSALARPARAPRVRPSDPAWPSPAQWEALNRRLGGELTRPTPLLAACEAAPRGAPCLDVRKNLHNPFYIGDQPAGTQVSGWLDAWSPQPSAYVVAARTTADVVAAVDFARAHNLRLVVKGGGHSYQGTSNAADSLLVWTRPMRAVSVHDAFVAKGCEGYQAPVPAATIEAGALWIDAYDAVTTKAGRYVQGGGCTSVGVAGHIQSGGFGSWSKGFGTAAASLIEAEVVTADGAIRIVNARRDPDLFWALKGGGGGCFGVVTRLTVRTHALPDRFGGAEGAIKAASDDAFRSLIARFVDLYADALCNPHWGEQISIRPGNVLHVSMVSQGIDKAQADAIWAPFFDWVRASPAQFTFQEPPGTYDFPARSTWDVVQRRTHGSKAMNYDERPGASPVHAWWADDQDQVGAFLYGYESLWLPETLLRRDRRNALVEALFAASRHTGVDLHFNKGLAGAPPQALAASRETAMNPAAMDAFALAIIATGGPPSFAGPPTSATYLAFAREKAKSVAEAAAVLARVAPGAGSYVSESNYFNAGWREAFWGSNYARLKAVKSRYDPGGLFIVHHGVGSEDWSADGFTPLTTA